MQNYSRSQVAQCGGHGEWLKRTNALYAEFQSHSAFAEFLNMLQMGRGRILTGFFALNAIPLWLRQWISYSFGCHWWHNRRICRNGVCDSMTWRCRTVAGTTASMYPPPSWGLCSEPRQRPCSTPAASLSATRQWILSLPLR